MGKIRKYNVVSKVPSITIRNFIAGYYVSKHSELVKKILVHIRNLEYNLFSEGIFLQIEPTTKCNLHCNNCTHHTIDKPYDLSVETLKNILQKHKHISSIKFQGLGEPFLCSNLKELCEIARWHGKLTITTNGTCIDYDILTFLTSIIISLDSLDPEQNKQNKSLRYNTEIVLNNIIKISKIPHLDVRVNFVRTSQNYNQESAIRDFCNLHNVKMDVTPVQNWAMPSESDWEEKHRFVCSERELFGKLPKTKSFCRWLKGKAHYYDALGRTHICCIRMNTSQIDPYTSCCDMCPD